MRFISNYLKRSRSVRFGVYMSSDLIMDTKNEPLFLKKYRLMQVLSNNQETMDYARELAKVCPYCLRNRSLYTKYEGKNSYSFLINREFECSARCEYNDYGLGFHTFNECKNTCPFCKKVYSVIYNVDNFNYL